MPTGGLIAGIGDFGVTELVTQAEQAKDSAESSASTATTKANQASTSATTATTQAGIATTKATEASNSATASANSASASQTSASNASTSESNALNYKNSAVSAANTATTKAGEAQQSAWDAQSSADSASASKNATSEYVAQFSSLVSDNKIIKRYTIAELRLLSPNISDPNNTFFSTDTEKEGFWKVKAGSTEADNLGVILVCANGVRLERIIENNEVYPEWFGAVSNGTTDDTQAIQSAINTGKTVRLQAKTYGISSSILVKTGTKLVGAGKGKSIIYALVDNFIMLNRFSDNYEDNSIEISDLTLWGYGDRNQTLGDDNCRMMRIGNVSNIILKNIQAKYSRQMSLTASGDKVRVLDCDIEYSYRDGINVTDCKTVIVTGCSGRFIQDDFIASHVSSSVLDGSVVNEPSVISNNILFNGQGIVCLGARNINISNNTLRLVKGRAIAVGFDGTEGLVDAYNINITNNVISDVINGSVAGGVSSGNGIYLNLPSATKGQFDYSTQSWGKPDPYINKKGSPFIGAFSINVTGNSLINTLSGTTNFSDAGFGQLWTSTGFQNPAFVGNIGFVPNVTSTLGIKINGSINSMRINGNNIVGFSRGLTFNTNPYKKDIEIEGNTFARNVNSIVFDQPSIPINATVSIFDNLFNTDPFGESLDRTSTGGWNNVYTATANAITILDVNGVSIYNNTFRNSKKTLHKTSNLTYQFFDNVIEKDANDNGIGLVFNEIANKIVFVDSDYTSNAYGSVQSSQNLLESSSIPTSGYYQKHSFVKNTALGISTGTALTGWFRATDGNTHVLNVDWIPVYVANPTAYIQNQSSTAQTASVWISGNAKVGSITSLGVISTAGTITPSIDNAFAVGSQSNRFTQFWGVRANFGDATTLDGSAIVQFNSTNRGVLLPRLNTGQINLISSPAKGLEVFNTDLNCPCFYDGTVWKRVSHSAM